MHLTNTPTIKSIQWLIIISLSEEIKNKLDSNIFLAEHFQNEHNKADKIQSDADL